MIEPFVPAVKEFYFRAKYPLSGTHVTYELRDVTVQFGTATYEEFRRFQSLMGEEEIVKDLLQNLDPTDVFFDIGANVGTYSCFAAEKLDRGRVVAFEPEPNNANRLRENASRNDQDIDLHRLALSDSGGRTQLELDGTTMGAGQHSLGATGSADTIEIAQQTGDHLVAREDVPAPTVLKIDVEGAEMKVLLGLQDTLSRESCRLVYCEVHPERLRAFGHTVSDLDGLLRDCGFTVHNIKQTSHKFFIKAEKANAGTGTRGEND